MMETTNRTLRELVSDNPNAAKIFEHYGLDFCCHGAESLRTACQSKGVDVHEVSQELESLPNDLSANRYYQWDLGFLVDYIFNNHHRYIRSNTPLLRGHLSKVVQVHGTRHPELICAAEIFDAASAELDQHLLKEEVMIFPYIRQLVYAQANNQIVPRTPFGSVSNPIAVMMSEHDAAGDAFAQIRELLDEYEPPTDACETLRLTYHELEEFEHDLHMHVFLENAVLFPRALKLETEVLNNMGH
ncbi:MAG: iron-sulfur cluster repair di-iron protein [Bacteroidetes bacterium]|nr:iron-sulfur cluster repair di-iron protein [Bacteroidota bacterium]